MEGCSIKKCFLGWERPFLHSVAEYFLTQYTSGTRCDLQNILPVVPVSRAGRRLEELLVADAAKQNVWLIPPDRILSTGDLPEYVIPQRGEKIAGRMERTGAWSAVLAELPPDQARTLFGDNERVFEDSDLSRVAEQLDDISSELGGAVLTFEDVAHFFQSGTTSYVDTRWDVLGYLYKNYLELLTRHGLADKNERRRTAITERKVNSEDEFTKKEIVLLGAVDLLEVHKKLLGKYAKSVTALIFAPEDCEPGFDEYGALQSTFWCEQKRLHFRKDQIMPAVNPYEQATAVAAKVAEFGSEYTAENISLGVTSDQYTPYVEQQLGVHDVPCRVAGGTPLIRTQPVRLLSTLAHLLETGTFNDFATFVRQPDVLRYLCRHLKVYSRTLLKELDAFQEKHLQSSFFLPFPDDEILELPERVRTSVRELVKEFLKGPDRISTFRQPVLTFVKKIYGASREYRENHPADAELIEVFRAISDVCEEAASIEIFAERKLGPAQFLQLIIRELSRRSTTPQPTGAAIEILGWLELTLDDAPCLLVAGMNEGQVPESLNEDLFLPDSLRTHLQLLDNKRRFARDVYALSSMLESKKCLTFLFSRHAANGDPQQPSRLFFLEPDENVIVQRVRDFTGPVLERFSDEMNSSGELPLFQLREPDLSDYAPSSIMRVTEFRDYLHCPYRYYLKHVLKTSSVNDEVFELDSARFGVFLHTVLCDFGRSDVKDSTNEKKIFDYLQAQIEVRAGEEYGTKPLPAVLIQLEQMKARLRAFAHFQAEWKSAGWEILHVEYSPSETDPVMLYHDEGSTGLFGTIDRIDRNRDGQYMVLDYKTGDNISTPEKTHLNADGNWIDLQLPLYEYLLQQKGIIETSCGLSYIPLSSLEQQHLQIQTAGWGTGDLESALSTAKEVAAAVSRGEFWPPSERVSPFDDYAQILGVGQFGAHYVLEQSIDE